MIHSCQPFGAPVLLTIKTGSRLESTIGALVLVSSLDRTEPPVILAVRQGG